MLDDAEPDDGDALTDSRTFSGVPAQNFVNITEEMLGTGWSLSDVTGDGGFWHATDQVLSIQFAKGEDVTCHFSNTYTEPNVMEHLYLPTLIKKP